MGTHPIFESDFDSNRNRIKKLLRHGPYARTRKGYLILCYPIQKICPIMAKAICRRNQGRHLQARQEGLQAITHWCPPQRYLRCWQVPLLDWIQDPPCSQIHGSCPRTSRRSLLHDQACCWHEKAFGKKPKGQGRQIPFDSLNLESTVSPDT